MLVYGLNLILSYFVTKIYSISSIRNGNKKGLIRVLLSALCMIIVAGSRHFVGTDTISYIYRFKQTSALSLHQVLFGDIVVERGFTILLWVISRFSLDVNFMLTALAALTILPILYFIYRFSENYSLGLFLFITSMFYYSTFNGMRQMLAVSMLLISLMTFKNRKFVSLIFCVISVSIHSFTLFVIPIFFAIYKVKKPEVFAIAMMLIASILTFIPSSMVMILKIFSSVGSTDRVQDYVELLARSGYGSSIIRLLVAFIPLALLLLFKRKLLEYNPELVVFINGTVIYNFFYILSLKDWLFARMNMYFTPFALVGLTFVPLIGRGQTNKYLIRIILMALYLFYMIFLLPRESDLLPYVSVLWR